MGKKLSPKEDEEGGEKEPIEEAAVGGKELESSQDAAEAAAAVERGAEAAAAVEKGAEAEAAAAEAAEAEAVAAEAEAEAMKKRAALPK